MPARSSSQHESQQASGQARKIDRITVANADYGRSGAGAINGLNTISLTMDMTKPMEMSFDIGDDATYNALAQDTLRMGAPFKVWVNDRLHLTGRVEMTAEPISADGGVPMQFTIRTKLSDAFYAMANPDTRYKQTTIQAFILALFKPLGFTIDTFDMRADLARDLLTGKSSKYRESPIALEQIQENQLKVNPPETIYAAADRILKRHGLMLWDAPDGKIVIGAPDDKQDPLYSFFAFNDNRSSRNNILSATRTRDWSQAPSVVGVFGMGGKLNWRASKAVASAQNNEILNTRDQDGRRSFHRPLMLSQEQVKSKAYAQRVANRELTDRSKAIDAWEIEVDGWSYWSGEESIPYAVNTVCRCYTSLVGGPVGSYLIYRIQQKRDPDKGDITRLTLMRKGLWVL